VVGGRNAAPARQLADMPRVISASARMWSADDRAAIVDARRVLNAVGEDGTRPSDRLPLGLVVRVRAISGVYSWSHPYASHKL